MSEKKSQQNSGEEIDLGQLFNAIGKLFKKIYSFIGWIFKSLFSIVIYALKPIVNNIKLISIILLVMAIAGYTLDKIKRPVYSSKMIVEPYFESKYQLVNNIDYYNALIKSNNSTELAKIFEIDTLAAKKIVSFELEIGPETKNDLLLEYNEYISEVDSVIANNVSFTEYVDNRDILAGKTFSIVAESYKSDIFKSLEKGFINTFENKYSKKLKKLRDSSLLAKRFAYLNELEKIDSLQSTYLYIKKTESEDSKVSIGPSSLFPLLQEKTQTKEFELFQEELIIREKIREIDNTLIRESEFCDILANFKEAGEIETDITSRFLFIFPLLSFLALVLLFILFNVFKFIRKYE